MSEANSLQHLLAKYDLQRVGAEIAASLRPAIHIRKQTQRQVAPGKPRLFGLLGGKPKETIAPKPWARGTSHLGGRPEVAPGFQWPRWKGKPLGFLAQIQCAEVAPHDPEHLWPTQGSLSFFYAIADAPWGGDLSDVGCWSVVYDASTDLHPAELPPDFDKEILFPTYPVSFRVFSTLPGAPENFDDAASEAFFELRAELRETDMGAEAMHQTLGHPDAVQGPVEDEWEEFQKKMNRPDDGSDWKLLLQFDSDNDLNVMWGDAGMLYFGIRENAFRARRFEETQFTWQCC